MTAPATWLTQPLLDALPVGVAVLAGDLRCLYSNPEGARLLGDLSGQPAPGARTALPPSLRAAAALAAHAPASACGYDPARDLWIQQQGAPYLDGVLLSLRDVTAEVSGHLAQARASVLRRAADKDAPVLLWVGDGAGCWYVNPEWQAFTGQALADVLGGGWEGGLHPEDLAGWTRLVTGMAGPSADRDLVVRVRHQDGTWRRLLAQGVACLGGAGGWAVALVESAGAPPGGSDLGATTLALCASLDVDAVLNEAASLAVPALTDWCIVRAISDDGRVVREVRAHADEQLRQAAEIGARYVGALFHAASALSQAADEETTPVDPAALVASARDERHAAALRELDVASAVQIPLRVRGRLVGQLLLIGTGRRPLGEAATRAAGQLAVPMAIAVANALLYRQTRESEIALKALNEEMEAWADARTADLDQINYELAVRNRELQDFAYVASHDLQEPLRKIRAFSSLLVTDYADALGEEARHYTERIEESAARMSRLIADLLAFSRVTTKGSPLVPVDLNTVLTDVISDVEIRIKETGGRVDVDVLPTVTGDPVQMHQLFQNLVSNALKYRRMDVPPHVRVSGRIREDGNAEVVVEDNGIGFEQKHAERIFSPFQRLHAKHAYEGTGMGLAIVRRIVERHRGRVAATSQTGCGSRFTVSLPCAG